VQLAAGQGRLQHVAGVHGALRLAGADHGVQFVDEQDDVALLLLEIGEHGLEPLLELAAVLGAGQQGAHVEVQHALAAQALGHLVVDDALGQPLDDGGLADAGLADQHGVVLGAALQDLDAAADFFVTADHRIELALLGPLGQVDGVFLQGLTILLGVGVHHLLAAAQFVDGLFDRLPVGAGLLQYVPERALQIQRPQDEQLAGDVLVTPLLRQLVGQVQDLDGVVRQADLAGRTAHARQAVQALAQLGAQLVDAHAGPGQQVPAGAAVLVQQRDHYVFGLDQLVVAPRRQALRIGEGQLKLAGQFVHSHFACTSNHGSGRCGRPVDNSYLGTKRSPIKHADSACLTREIALPGRAVMGIGKSARVWDWAGP
jgi:hypothetical protein